jgi:hypothetical protein
MKRVLIMAAALLLSLPILAVAAVPAVAGSRHSQNPVPHGKVLRLLHAQIHWVQLGAAHADISPSHSYSGTAVLGGHTVLLFRTTRAAGSEADPVSSISLGFPSGNSSGDVYSEQSYDALFSSDGTTVSETDYPAGTLAEGGPCGTSITCSGLTYRFTDCGQISESATVHVHSYDCYSVYSASTSSRTYGYRLGWWGLSTTNAEQGYALNQVILRNGMAGCSQCGVQEDAVTPEAPRYVSSGSETITLGINLQYVSGGVSETFQIYSQEYGPSPNYPTSTQFQFQWGGSMPGTTSIAMHGGEEWQFLTSHGYPLFNFIDVYYV